MGWRGVRCEKRAQKTGRHRRSALQRSDGAAQRGAPYFDSRTVLEVTPGKTEAARQGGARQRAHMHLGALAAVRVAACPMGCHRFGQPHAASIQAVWLADLPAQTKRLYMSHRMHA